MMFLQLLHIKKTYKSHSVFNDLSFWLAAHQTLSILGKSGCGKSTLLKIIAGLEQPDTGNIFLQEKDITILKPVARNIVYLFQEALLFPNLNVAENIAFGLRIRKQKESDIKRKVEEMVQSLELENQLTKMPHQLSGGQKQRVAFGRALIIQPPLILLDEPFSSLDAETRTNMQDLYKRVANHYKLTALFVTHDVKEALIMGDVISYMQDGLLQVYANKEEFIGDAKTGVQRELSFWKNVN